MTSETIGIITTNAVLVLGAVWRVSGILSNIKTELVHIIQDMAKDTAALNVRLNAIEARLLNLERKGV